MSKKVQHTLVLGHYETIQESNPFITRYVDEMASQAYPQPVFLPAVLDEGRILGPLTFGFAVVTYDRDDLVWLVRIERNQREVIYTVDVSEILGLLF